MKRNWFLLQTRDFSSFCDFCRLLVFLSVRHFFFGAKRKKKLIFMRLEAEVIFSVAKV